MSKEWRESIQSILIAVFIALMLRSFVVEAFKIPSGSMIPTLAIGDQIFVNKFRYGVRVPFTSIRLVDFAEPERGEVIVFICPVEPHQDYIKRVVVLPGDEIMVRNYILLVNGKAVERKLIGTREYTDRDLNSDQWTTFRAEAWEETLDGRTYTVLQDPGVRSGGAHYGPSIVPEGHVFMMGDNRDHSYDSRMWGTVPVESILGRSLVVWWSWGKDYLDTERMGTWIN